MALLRINVRPGHISKQGSRWLRWVLVVFRPSGVRGWRARTELSPPSGMVPVHHPGANQMVLASWPVRRKPAGERLKTAASGVMLETKVC